MSCHNTTSNITFKLDKEERFCSFEFTKVACGKKITPHLDYNRYCRGKTLHEILGISFRQAVNGLKAKGEEEQFVLFLEWEALRCAAARYLGIDDTDIDTERCHILSVAHDEEEGVEIIQLILPPKDLPQIPACG